MFVAELGMSPKKFWKLEFYEWSLWMNRINKLNEDKEQDYRLRISLQRSWMALYANFKRDEKKRPEPFEGKDFLPFPEEIEAEEKEALEKKLSPVELENKTKELTKQRALKRGG